MYLNNKIVISNDITDKKCLIAGDHARFFPRRIPAAEQFFEIPFEVRLRSESPRRKGLRQRDIFDLRLRSQAV